MVQELFLILACTYLLMMAVCALSAARTRYSVDRTSRPTVSIIIAARNEENNIRKCLDSVTQARYPASKLEVIIVDDRSTDATQAIVTEVANRYQNVKLVVAKTESSHLRGKANAVTQGIDASSGEILLFTDADCLVPSGWVEETVKYYDEPKVGIVAGFTSLRGQGCFSRVQALDWFVLFAVAAGAAGLHFPITAVGNNLSVRRKAYEEVGGYRKIPFSVTEDYALFHAVTTTTRYQARFPLDRETLVQSSACSTWRDLYQQKKRWFTGGRESNPVQLFLFFLAYLLYVSIVLSLFFLDTRVVLLGFALKTLADLCLALPAVNVFHRRKLLACFPLFEIYITLYVIVLPLVVLFGTGVVWKERVFDEKK